MKILIAVPCMDQVPAPFCQSLATLNRVGECLVAFQISSLIYTARDELAKKAIELEADYVLWLDSDMVFNPDTLQRLIADKEKGDIITGLYHRRVSPFSPVAFSKLEIVGDHAESEGITEIPEDLFEVEACGFGCVLTPTSVFIDVASKFGKVFIPESNCGEDISFCWRARQCGYKIICDPTIQLGHVGHHIITRDFWEVYKGKNESKTD